MLLRQLTIDGVVLCVPDLPNCHIHSLRVASLSEHIDRDGGGEDNNMLTDFLRDFQEKMVKQVHNRSLQKDGIAE